MPEPDFIFRDKTIAIIGLGLMGGSLALALRDSKAARQIIAIDTDRDTRARAALSGIAAYDSLDAVAPADLIVLATPVRTIIELLPGVGKVARKGAIVMDLGSVMRDIVNVMARLPADLQPISGHPMCGKETAGFLSADAALFQNAVFVLTPLAQTKADTVKLVSSLVNSVGARPFVLDADRHDRLVAAISHLPYMVASALVLTADELADKDDLLFMLAASGFRDTSRLAASDTHMMLDILLTNGENVANAMREYARQFEGLAQLIENRNEQALRAILEGAARRRRKMMLPQANLLEQG